MIIGLGYKMKRGKDTLAQFLIDMRGNHTPWGIDIRRYAFADYLKQEVNLEVEKRAAEKLTEYFQRDIPVTDARAYTGLCFNSMKELCDEKGVEWDPNPPMDDIFSPFGKQRKLLQWWGTEYRRAEDPDYWIKKLVPAIKQDKPDVAVITDLRFPNEHELADIKIRLERLNPDGTLFKLPEENHASENSLEGYAWDRAIYASNTTYLKYKGLEIFDQVVGRCA